MALDCVIEAEKASGVGSLVVVARCGQRRLFVDLTAEQLDHRIRPSLDIQRPSCALENGFAFGLVAVQASRQVAQDDGINRIESLAPLQRNDTIETGDGIAPTQDHLGDRAIEVTTWFLRLEGNGLFEVGDCLRELLLREPGVAVTAVGQRVRGGELDGPSVLGECVVVFPFGLRNTAAADVREGVSGVEADGMVEIGARLVILLLVGPTGPAAVVGEYVIGGEPDDLLEISDRLVPCALVRPGAATASVRVDVVGIEANRLVVVCDCLVVFLRAVASISAINAGGCI